MHSGNSASKFFLVSLLTVSLCAIGKHFSGNFEMATLPPQYAGDPRLIPQLDLQLLLSTYNWSRLSISPDGSKAIVTFEGSLYEVDLYKSTAIEIENSRHTPQEVAYGGSYSPDGNTIVYSVATDVSKPAEICIFSLNNRMCHRLLALGKKFHHIKPTFTPDGQKIGFCASNKSDLTFPLHLNSSSPSPVVFNWLNYEIYVLDRSSKTITQLPQGTKSTNNFGLWCSFTFTSDGSKVIYSRPSGRNKLYTLFIVDVQEHSSPIQVNLGPSEPISEPREFHAVNPVISPDGKKLLYIRSSSDARDELWLKQLDGSDSRKLTDLEGVQDAVFSPDGSKIYFLNFEPYKGDYPKECEDPYEVHLNSIEADRGNLMRVYTFVAPTRCGLRKKVN